MPLVLSSIALSPLAVSPFLSAISPDLQCTSLAVLPESQAATVVVVWKEEEVVVAETI